MATQKQTYDMRGSQANIARLVRFDMEGFVHMLFYRLLIFIMIIYGVAILAYLLYQQGGAVIKSLTIIVWVLLTPQVYETSKTLSLVATRGLAFGHLSSDYKLVMKTKYGKSPVPFNVIPYLVLVLWAIGFAAMLMWWNI